MILLLACADPPPAQPPGPAVWVESPKVKAGEAVRLHAPTGVQLPPVEGLTFREATVSDSGRTTWEITGKNGSYVVAIPAQEVGGAPVTATTLYVDIGVEGPTGGPMEDLVALPPRAAPLWPWLVAALVGTAAATAGALLAWRRWGPQPAPPPPEPADLVARREWAKVRARTDLAPAELALELSAVYRRYLEAAHRWPATSRTTREILDNLSGSLVVTELDAARRLLGAMDLVKFAERQSHDTLFASFDQDFDRLCKPVGRSR